jgi:hypothetical protein
MPTEKDFKTLRDRVVASICRELNVNNIRTFHGVDMIKNCARGFLDERGIAQYEFSGEHDYVCVCPWPKEMKIITSQ